MAYIPKKHEKYNLLPECRANGGEVFDYPAGLISEIEKIMGFSNMVFPYGYKSYEEYYASLDEVIKMHENDPKLVELLDELKSKVKELNVKEDWSILRYVGEDDGMPIGVTPGMAYYWPTCKSNPVYRGVVNDEEFTSYIYPTESYLWEILEDPTGMAYRTIYEKSDGYITKKSLDEITKQIEHLAQDCDGE